MVKISVLFKKAVTQTDITKILEPYSHERVFNIEESDQSDSSRSLIELGLVNLYVLDVPVGKEIEVVKELRSTYNEQIEYVLQAPIRKRV